LIRSTIREKCRFSSDESRYNSRILRAAAVFVWFGLAAPALGQILGDWQGVLEYPARRLVIILHLQGRPANLSASVDSPVEGLFQIPLDYVNFKDDELRFRITRLGVVFAGELDEDEIRGSFSQTGQPHLPLRLRRLETSGSAIPPAFAGEWAGTVNGLNGPLRVVVRIDGTSALVDIPDQAIAGLVAAPVATGHDEIRFGLGTLLASFRGKIAGAEIRGTFSQNAYDAPLLLKRKMEPEK
jgi:hypothetical protein